MKEKQILYIPFDEDAFLKAFQDSDFDLMDDLKSEHDELWKTVFNSIASGKYRIAWYDCYHNKKNHSFMRYALHQSPKNDGLQLSCMEVRNGNIIPTSDRQYIVVSDFLRDWLPNTVTVFFA